MSETGRATLAIPGTPPSMNRVGLHSHWTVGRAAKQRWEGYFYIALLEQRVPKRLKSIRATATLRFKQRRRRDELLPSRNVKLSAKNCSISAMLGGSAVTLIPQLPLRS